MESDDGVLKDNDNGLEAEGFGGSNGEDRWDERDRLEIESP